MENDKIVKKQPEEKTSMTKKLGDTVERVGEKLKDMGAHKAGTAVYNAGNKLEHSKDVKK